MEQFESNHPPFSNMVGHHVLLFLSLFSLLFSSLFLFFQYLFSVTFWKFKQPRQNCNYTNRKQSAKIRVFKLINNNAMQTIFKVIINKDQLRKNLKNAIYCTNPIFQLEFLQFLICDSNYYYRLLHFFFLISTISLVLPIHFQDYFYVFQSLVKKDCFCFCFWIECKTSYLEIRIYSRILWIPAINPYT